MRAGFLLFFSLLLVRTSAQKRCDYLPFPFFNSVTVIKGGKIVSAANNYPKKIDFVGGSISELPANIFKDSLIGLSFQNSDINGAELMAFIKTNHVKHLELHKCRIDDPYLTFLTEMTSELNYLGIFNTPIMVIQKNVSQNDMSIEVKGVELLDSAAIKYIFSCKAVVLDSIPNKSFRSVIEGLLRGDASCVVFQNCQMRELMHKSFEPLNDRIWSMTFSNCNIGEIPRFLANINGNFLLSLYHCKFKLKLTDYYPRVDSLRLRGKDRFKPSEKLREIFPNASGF